MARKPHNNTDDMLIFEWQVTFAPHCIKTHQAGWRSYVSSFCWRVPTSKLGS